MQTYCLRCKKHVDNIGLKKVTMANKGITEKSRCAYCMVEIKIFKAKSLIKK